MKETLCLGRQTPGQGGLENWDPGKMINHKTMCKMKGSGCCSGSAWEGVCAQALLPLLGAGSAGWAMWCQLALAQGTASPTMVEQRFT